MREHGYLRGIPYWESTLKDPQHHPSLTHRDQGSGWDQYTITLFWLLEAKKEPKKEPEKEPEKAAIAQINKLHTNFTTNYIYIKSKTYRIFLPGVFYTTPELPGATEDTNLTALGR